MLRDAFRCLAGSSTVPQPVCATTRAVACASIATTAASRQVSLDARHRLVNVYAADCPTATLLSARRGESVEGIWAKPVTLRNAPSNLAAPRWDHEVVCMLFE